MIVHIINLGIFSSFYCIIIYNMSLNTGNRETLDTKLSWPFKKWDIIADKQLKIIWAFDSVAYHWWNPDRQGSLLPDLWKYIYALFENAISRQWRLNWEAIPGLCWDDDVYIDRREYDLSEHYRFATQAEKELFNTLISSKE